MGSDRLARPEFPEGTHEVRTSEVEAPPGWFESALKAKVDGYPFVCAYCGCGCDAGGWGEHSYDCESPSAQKELEGDPLAAVRFLLMPQDRIPGGGRDPDGRPFECYYCPFATEETEFHSPANPADPGEGHYDCALLNRKGRDAVWGEAPLCNPEEWRDRARAEVGKLLRNNGEVLRWKPPTT